MNRFRPYFHYLRAVRPTLIAGILFGIVYAAANGAGLPVMIKAVFPRVFPAAGSAAPPLTTTQILLVALYLPLVFLVRGVSGYLNAYLIQKAGVRVLEALRLDFFRKLQVLPLAFFHKRGTGDLMSRGMADTNQLQAALTTAANDLTKQPATLVFALGAVTWLAYQERGLVMVLVCLAIVPLCVFPIRFVGKKLVKRAAQLMQHLGSASDCMNENLAAVREVRAFGLEEREVQRFSTISRALVHAQIKVAKYAQALTPAIEIISAVGISITFVYAYRQHVPLESFLAIVGALYVCYDPVKKLGGLNNELKKGTAALDRIEEVLTAPVSISDPAQPVEANRLRGEIEFRDVTFSYVDGPPALSGISAHIPAGTMCALVGPTGAGKTSFANLVPRFFDATAGSLTIDGVDVRNYRLADLRGNIAIVSQDPILFRDTITNNLLLGRANATRQEVEEAARHAFAHEFITKLPQGYNTIVGERGATLSGGQRQRVALARAFLRNAPIMILDEANSALDAETEEKIQTALAKLVVGKTVLIIAHRFSTIRDASLILVFDKGRLVSRGSHAELLSQSPLYKRLYETQQQPF